MDDCQVPDNNPEQAIQRMMDAHGSRLLRLCYLQLGDRQLAEDAVQDTFLKAWRGYAAFRQESSEVTWLTAIAINCCRSLKRKPWHRLIDRRVPAEELPEASAPFEPYDDTVTRAVMALPPASREAILMHYYQGLTVREIAQALSLPLSTVTTRLIRARDKLEKSLERWYRDE
ncbi:MAG: RNA polymerase sigma factor [Clostridiales bacterium]|nr:RNA polymerase sigma factor [Clostridiales bacterium]